MYIVYRRSAAWDSGGLQTSKTLSVARIYAYTS